MAIDDSENKASEAPSTADKQNKTRKPPKGRSAGADAPKQKRARSSKKETGAAKGNRKPTSKTPRKTARNMTPAQPDDQSEAGPAGGSPEESRNSSEDAGAPEIAETESAAAPAPEKPLQTAPADSADTGQPAAGPTASDASRDPAPSGEGPTPPSPSEPLPGIVKWFIGGFIVLIALIVITSYQNMQKYFVVAQHGAVEIWKGKFSPMGRKLVVIMPGVLPPAEKKDVYTREDVFPLIFQYYINKADTLMEVPGAPDFIDIKTYLNRARDYALNEEMQSTVKAHLDDIDRTVLLYKADVAAARGTAEDLESAREYLNQAAALSPDEAESNLIQQKMATVEKQIAALGAAQAEQPSESTAPATPEDSSETPPQEQAPENREQTF
jgi:hypothetical protein